MIVYFAGISILIQSLIGSIIAVNGITQYIEYPVQYLMYVDDLLMYIYSRDTPNQHITPTLIHNFYADFLGKNTGPSLFK